MEVKYISSACLQIKTSDACILTDPWFTQGVYDGAWFSLRDIDPFDYIEEPDFIYVSHIHPDHYDPNFIKKIFNKFGKKKILIPDFEKNYLLIKGKSDGLELTPLRDLHIGNTSFYIEENDMGSLSDIDSALIIHDKKTNKTMLNLNDCVPHEPHLKKLKSIISNLKTELDLLALGYTGAGPFPQTYFDPDQERDILISKAEEKKKRGFKRYSYYDNFFNAQYNLPFAGEYLLGGNNIHLNQYRGVADAHEVTSFDEKAIVFNPGGKINLECGSKTNLRDQIYSKSFIDDRLKIIQSAKMDYEKDFFMAPEKINFPRLMNLAAVNAQQKSEINSSYYFVFSITSKDSVLYRYLLNCDTGEIKSIDHDQKINFEQYSEIFTDYRLMFGLLIGFYHWNNADIGSAYQTRRFPTDNFQMNVQGYLNFFTAA